MNTTILQLKEEVQALFKTLGLDLSKLERENKKYGCVFLPGTFCVEMSYRGCGEKGTLIQYWWECKLVQPL